jgi:hypothetical protein
MTMQTHEAPSRPSRRVRTVFGTHANLAHVWAQQSYSIGYSADRRMLFDGETIYSYGRHYPMARFSGVYDADGNHIVLFKKDGRSVSTAKHRSLTRRALHGLPVRTIYVEDVTAAPHLNAWHMRHALSASIADMANPMKNRDCNLDERLGYLQQYCEAIEDFMSLFDVQDTGELEAIRQDATARITAAMNAFNDPARVAKRAKAAKRREIAKATAHVTEALEALSDGREPRLSWNAEAVETWLEAGKPIETVQPLIAYLQRKHAYHEVELTARALDPNASRVLQDRRMRSYHDSKPVTPEQWLEGEGSAYASFGYYGGPTLVRRKGERLETSRGAEVPFKHAVLAYLKAAQCRRDGATWQRNGEKVAVGVYQLDAIDAQGNIRAGCHTIAFDEMQRLAVREVPHMVRPSYPLPALIAS